MKAHGNADSDQEREGQRLAVIGARNAEHDSRDIPIKIDSTASVAITACPASPAAISNDSSTTPAPTVPPTAIP